VDTTAAINEELIPPYGGELKSLLVEAREAAELRRYAGTLPRIRLSARSLCDLELLATGAFSPLDRFMDQADHARVLSEMRLASGQVFPVPVTLPVTSDTAIDVGSDVALCDAKQNPLAVMRIDEVYAWDRRQYACAVLGTESVRHPLVTEIAGWGDSFVSGELKVFGLPQYFDFPQLRLTPSEVRSKLAAFSEPNVVAFQTRNPLHRAHEEMIKLALEQVDGVLLMHPVVGLTKPGDVDHHARVRSYSILARRYFDPNRVLLSLLPLAMRFAGPREALWHAIIRRNYGANHFIVGRDHASPGMDEEGRPFYKPEAARKLVESFSEEIGVRVVAFEEFVYVPASGSYKERSSIAGGEEFVSLSGTKARNEFLSRGRRLPEWFMRPEVAGLLQESCPPRFREGICVWFTGLSAAGKSTTAEILTAMLARYGRHVTLLDGDVVRTNLSDGLGFDRAGRDANIRRIGFVASEIVRHGGVAVCAAISPYRETRNAVREMVGDNFIEVFVSTSLDICRERDPKGMYAKAEAGELENFTGVDDVYEEPSAAEIVIDGAGPTAEENAETIISFLGGRGLLQDDVLIYAE
jgi:sulfate adenylyltransferase